MTINSLSALNAYRNQLKIQQDITDTAPQESSGQSSFSNMVENSLKDATNTQYKAEDIKMDALTGGKVELSDLVTAVSNAELTLNTVVAVRDRVISAYQDIIRMPM